MRITGLDVWVVNVPYTAPFVSSFEVRSGTTRTVIRLRTDDGLTGWGETMHGDPVAALVRKLYAQYEDTDPFEVERQAEKLRMVPFFYGYLGYAAMAALEMACHDLMGRATGQPLHNLIGGMVRDRVPLTYVATPHEATGDEGLLADIRGAGTELGIDTIKLKGSADPREDVRRLELIRARFPDVALRVDPNGHWPMAETIRLGRRLTELDLEYLEDPCWGLEAMAQVRAALRIPLCTNMCVVRMEDVAPALRLGAIDVLHGDVHKWGGIASHRKLAGICEAAGWGMNLHSGGELGLSTAAHLHVVAATPQIRYAIDTVYYLFADDIIEQPLVIKDGALPVPTGPGLGVEPELAKLDHYARLHDRDGDLLL
ncbi:MAG TPA: enolase C-terminal domain-like protein [Pseudonocardiaceae bacterium]|jgi:glucarate dehydratase|nr:enolase C-terminal domain-like protein [Pseudonocardiaceae bacterium]